MLRRLSIAAFASFIVAAVASCGGILPNSAVPGHVARGYYPVDDTTPLIALIRERGIEAPSHFSPTPILDQLNQAQIDMMLSKIPLGRTGKPDEVAALREGGTI